MFFVDEKGVCLVTYRTPCPGGNPGGLYIILSYTILCYSYIHISKTTRKYVLCNV